MKVLSSRDSILEVFCWGRIQAFPVNGRRWVAWKRPGARMRNSLGFMLSESQRSLGSQTRSREMRNVSTQGCSFKGRNAGPVFCPAGWEQMCTTVVRFVLCNRDETRSSPDRHRKLPFLSQSVEPVFMEGVTCIFQRVSVKSSLTFI